MTRSVLPATRAGAPLLVLLLVAPLALGVTAPDGHWEDLGEDGRIWVPAEPPVTPAARPGEDLGPYHNVTETADAFAALADARPDLVTVTTIGESVQGRPLLKATITGPGDATGRTRILVDGAHHGNEVIGSEIVTRFAQGLVADYDGNATLRALLDLVAVDVVPIVNPDGVARVPMCAHYADCRRNANGVDLNRNYANNWGGPGSGGSPGSATYRGPAPLSEPESTALAALLDAHDYALHVTMHSGTELILWPLGYTTSPPPEEDAYRLLGDALTDVTGVTNGQSSRILYLASGTTMDQAYETAAGWRPLSFTPEVYGGSGNAYDWWRYFNPADHAVNATVAQWHAGLRHLLAVTPLYAPATLAAPGTVHAGPDATDVTVTVDASPRRPLTDAMLRLDAADAPVTVTPDGGAPVPEGADPASVTFTLHPARGGTFPGAFTLDAGPAGSRTHAVTLALTQVELDVSVAADAVDAPESNAWTVTVGAGPFERVDGTLTVRLLPDDVVLSEATFHAAPGAPVTVDGVVDAAALAHGAHRVVAEAAFTAHADGTGTPGEARASAGFHVHRPQVVLDKRFEPESRAGDPVLVTVRFTNEGSRVAEDLVLRETIPAGYALTTRDGPVPVPPNPVARPAPDAVEPRVDGGVDLVWHAGDVAPGDLAFVQYRVVPVLPGTHTLPSAWAYAGTFPAARMTWAEDAAPEHVVLAHGP